MNLKGKRILVTGGSSGIGLAVAQHLIEMGAKVVISGRCSEALSATVARLQTGDDS